MRSLLRIFAALVACCHDVRADPFRPVLGSAAPAIVNALVQVIPRHGSPDAEKVVRKALRKLESEFQEEQIQLRERGTAEADRAAHRAAHWRRRQWLSQSVLGVTVWRRKLEFILELCVAQDAANWVYKYGEQGRFGLPLSADDPLTTLQRAQCLMALYVMGAHRDSSEDGGEEAPAVDFVDAEVLEVLELARGDSVRSALEEVTDLGVKYSVPDWFAERLEQQLGRDVAEGFLRVSNEPGPTVLRLNPLRTSREQLIQDLSEHKYVGLASKDSPLCVVLEKNGQARRASLQSLQLWLDGHFEVQAEGSQLACLALRPEPGMTVGDFCAGRGGKALTLAVQLQSDPERPSQIFAYDVDEAALKQIPASAKRSGVEQSVIVDPFKKHLERAAKERGVDGVDGVDGVIVDVPCSSSGALRRHPSLRWQMEAQQPQGTKALKLQILEEAARLVRVGGVLVYATCSVLAEENQEVVDAFLKTHVGTCFRELDFNEEDLKWGWNPVQLQNALHHAPEKDLRLPANSLLLLPNVQGSSYDGFFISRLVRQATDENERL